MSQGLHGLTLQRDGQTIGWQARLSALFTRRPDLRGVHERADVVEELARWSA